MVPTTVDDAEDLYRSIRADNNEYDYQDGRVFFSSTAFDDRDMKPSVDRSALRADPADARQSQSDGVAKISTAAVRKTSNVEIVDAKGKPVGAYEVDAIHRPIENVPGQRDNPAHCQIECDPAMANKSRFKKLKAALAALANQHGFVVQPNTNSAQQT